MSRILADAQPAPPRVGCVLLRCRLGARGPDMSNPSHGPLTAIELRLDERAHKALGEELRVIAGEVSDEPSESAVFFVDPGQKSQQYGGADAWARCLKGYLNARGFSASIAVAPSREAALAAARSRWGIVVIHEGLAERPTRQHAERRPAGRSTTGTAGAAGTTGTAGTAGAPARAQSRDPQLALPGLRLGKPKRAARR